MAVLKRAGKHITAYKTMLNYAEADNEPIACIHEKKESRRSTGKQKDSVFLTFFIIYR